MAFQFHISATDAVCLVPVNLRLMDRAIRQPNRSKSAQLAPTALSIDLAQPPPVANATTNRDRLNAFDVADDFEVHCASILSRPLAIGHVNLTNRVLSARPGTQRQSTRRSSVRIKPVELNRVAYGVELARGDCKAKRVVWREVLADRAAGRTAPATGSGLGGGEARR